MSVGNGDWSISPRDFWGMSTQEWWWIFDHKLIQANRMKDPNYISRSTWDEAHKAHKEKINGRT